MISRRNPAGQASTQPHTARAESLGDAAVDGLLAGLAAGAALLLTLAALSLLHTGGLAALPAALGAAAPAVPGAGASPPLLNALLAQLALGALGGLLWGVPAWLAAAHIRLPLWPAAILFGALFTFALRLILGQNSAGSALPLLSWPAACLIYGLTLGIITRGQQRQSTPPRL